MVDIHNPALDSLDLLLGTWRVEISNAQFLERDARLSGRMTASWLDGHALLVLRSVLDGGPPASTQVIGRNEDRADYSVFYADERGVSRIYSMTFDHNEWTQSRNDPGFHQRFVGRISKDAKRIDAAWTKSHDDGANWEHDFEIVYTKI